MLQQVIDYVNVNYKVLTKSGMDKLVKASCSGSDEYFKEVNKKHQIIYDEFVLFLDAFWPSRTYYTKNKTVAEIRSLVENYSCDYYIRFNPTDEREARDINFDEIIDPSRYDEESSCFSIALLKCVLHLFDNVINDRTVFCFTKGRKLILKENGTRVIKTIVMFYVEFSDGSIGYYDIADDPTHRIMRNSFESDSSIVQSDFIKNNFINAD